MTEHPYDPNSLADHLDDVLSSSQPPASDPDPLVETALRLSHGPRPQLSADVFARIQAQVLEANLAQPPVQTSSNPLARTVASIPGGTVTVVTVIIVVLMSVVAIVLLNGGDDDHNQATITLTPEVTPSSEATELPVLLPESTAEITETATPFVTATATPTASPTVPPLTATEQSTDEVTNATLPATIVIEGPVQAIDRNLVVIYDIQIVLPEDYALLDEIEAGDIIRVEGDYGQNSGQVALIALIVTFNDPNVSVNPASGEVYRDDGSCDNPPPDWAPAVGWRGRCEGGDDGPGNGNDTNNGNGNDGGRDDDDGDD